MELYFQISHSPSCGVLRDMSIHGGLENVFFKFIQYTDYDSETDFMGHSSS